MFLIYYLPYGLQCGLLHILDVYYYMLSVSSTIVCYDVFMQAQMPQIIMESVVYTNPSEYIIQIVTMRSYLESPIFAIGLEEHELKNGEHFDVRINMKT